MKSAQQKRTEAQQRQAKWDAMSPEQRGEVIRDRLWTGNRTTTNEKFLLTREAIKGKAV